MIIKRIHSQDAYYKLSPKKSGETSLNLSNEILQLIAPNLSKGAETPITFILFRADYLKALGKIINYSPLYITSSTTATEVTSDPNVFIKDFQAICTFFGDDEKKAYSVNLLYRTDGRIYLNSLEDSGSKFNLRHFLIEEASSLEFEKSGNDITLRLKYDSLENDSNSANAEPKLIVSEKNLTQFALSAIKHFDAKDHLNALVPYAGTSSPIKISKDNAFSLTGMFIETTLADIQARNLNHPRWFEDLFKLGDREVFLSTQWNGQGKHQLTLNDFKEMVRVCYGDGYSYKKGPNGEHQLYLAEDRPSLDSFKEGPLQQIFYGAPGTGKSFAIKKETEGRAVVRTTFHPDSDYSTFVGAYKPTSVDVPVMTIIGKEQVPVVNAKPEKKIVYEFVPQAFLKAYTGAWKNQDEPFFLVIEEINRGNCAQIFGDLFQLLDRNDETGLSEYPISPDEDIQKFLLTDKKFGFAELTEEQKAAIPEEVQSGELLILPKNLYIWATMNTSDQSLFPIDSAFKRRWDWKYVPIYNSEEGWQIEVKGARYDWWNFLEKMNDKISTTTHSEDKKLGYYFCKTKDGIINAETFVGKVIFYVWNDVFKDFAEEAGNLFKDENGDLLSYDKFYGVGADGNTKVLEDKVALFLEHLGVEPVMETNPDDVEEEEEDAEDAGGVRRGVAHRQLISVSFPDGTKFDISDGLTHFAVYLEAIKKIGLERAEPIAAASKYHRLNRPVISKERFPEIEADRYSYEQVGEYFLIKGMSNDTYINILNLCNEQLNLGISVEYRE